MSDADAATDLPVTLRAGCKVNLNLFITGRRQDGFHELDSIFLPLDAPFDLLQLSRGLEPGLQVHCSTHDIDPVSNTLTKTYAGFAEATGFAPPLHVELHKGIARGAGLGGGSSDAATLLRWLNTHAPSPLTTDNLLSLAQRIGADVPFFLYNTCCRAEGIGEKLTIIPAPLTGCCLVLICPPVQVSTVWAYKAYDQFYKQNIQFSPLTPYQSQAIRRPSLSVGFSGFIAWNDFEPAVFGKFPEVALH